MDNVSEKSSCLCGAVKIEAKEVNPKFSVCHCKTCRSWGGGPFFAVQCGTEVNIKGQDSVKIYESSSWASRGFCSECGTHLFFKIKKTGEYNMPLGLFPGLKEIEMSTEYFSDEKPGHYHFSNETKEVTKQEIMDYFASLG